MNNHDAPRDWREGRRLRAWELHEAGWSGARIAEALGVTPGAVSQWLTRAREGGGREALRTQPRPGKQPRLPAEQRAQVPALLAQGAEMHGFVGDVWTTKRVATVIQRTFGVRYHPAHISRLVRQLGWPLQKPVQRASQRDEAKVTAWREEEWPALQAKPRRRAARSCSETKPASTRCHLLPAPTPPAARRRCCARRSPTTIFR
jgi:transposase